MRIDEQVVHADDIKEGSGKQFYGTPIREMSIVDVDVRAELDMQARARVGLGKDSASIELFPGEIVQDNVIRRWTSAEVLGEQFYAEKPQVSFENSISGLKDPNYWDDYTARCA